MAIVYSTVADSFLLKDDASWATARGDLWGAADVNNHTSSNSSLAIFNIAFAARGGGANYVIVRSYFPFDLSGETGTVVSCELKIYLDRFGSAGDSADVTVVLATALNGSTADFGNVYRTGTTWGVELVTPITVSTTAGYHTFTLNSDGISEVNNAVASGTLTVGLVGDYYDFNGNAPPLSGNYTQIGAHYADYGSSDRRPYLDITYGTVGNATFFGTNF